MARSTKPRDIFKLRIVRTLTGEVVETVDREFRTENAARTAMERWPTATRPFGDLNGNPLHHHVQIINGDPAAGNVEVIARYLWIERRTMTVLFVHRGVTDDGHKSVQALDGSWRTLQRDMVWVKTNEEDARKLAELTAEVPDRGPIVWGLPDAKVDVPDGTIELHRGGVETPS